MVAVAEGTLLLLRVLALLLPVIGCLLIVEMSFKYPIAIRFNLF